MHEVLKIMVQPCRLVIGLRSIDLEHDLEGDTIDTINSYLKDNKEKYQEFHNHCHEIVGDNADLPETVDVTSDAIAPAPEKPKRGRKPKAPVEAVAPAPIPVPDAAPAAPVDTAPNAGGIPAFLDRNAPPAPAAVAPPPPMAAPPVPAAPVSPPTGVLAAKVVAELKRRGEGAADQGAGLVAWLAGAALCVPGASFQEACDCVSFLTDEKLEPVAKALQLA